MPSTIPPRHSAIAWAVMALTPLFFSTNLVFGRGVIGEVAPFTLAFLRWGAVALALAPFAFRVRHQVSAVLKARGGRILLLGALGMGVCGGVVYVGLQSTTATNGTLIYTTSPVFIILIEAAFAGRRIGWREALGSLIAFAGVATIVLRGDPAALLALDFTTGDLLILAAAIAWAVYSILYRDSELGSLPPQASFCLIAGAGALLLAPFAAYEWAAGAPMPATAGAWTSIAGIVVFASLLAFSGFQFGVRTFGPSLTGIFMYLLPPYGVLLAWLILGERFHGFHAAGIALVMAGVILATLPPSWFQPSRPSDGNVSSSQ